VNRGHGREMKRDFRSRSSVLNREMRASRYYRAYTSRYWRNEPLWFYSPSLTLGALGYGFFGHYWNNPYSHLWGWDYWNSIYPSMGGYTWWHYYSSWYWKPWGYRRPSYYRPSYDLVDYILASIYESAWEARLEERREAARQQYEDDILAAQAAEDQAQADALQAQADAAAEQAAQDEIQRAEAEALAQAQSNPGTPALSEEDQSQLAEQVEQISEEREKSNVSTPLNTGFENALGNKKSLYLVSFDPEGSFDGRDVSGNSPCQLHIGDILEREDDLIEGTGLATLRVKVGQPSSCQTGTLVTMTIPQLQDIYNSFQETMDAGAQELANKNQPNQ